MHTFVKNIILLSVGIAYSVNFQNRCQCHFCQTKKHVPRECDTHIQIFVKLWKLLTKLLHWKTNSTFQDKNLTKWLAVKTRRSKYASNSWKSLCLFTWALILPSWCFRRKLEKKQEGEDAPKQVPHTLESLREKDETMLANVDDEEKLEVRMCSQTSIITSIR